MTKASTFQACTHFSTQRHDCAFTGRSSMTTASTAQTAHTSDLVHNVLIVLLQGDPAWHEQAQAKEGQGLTVTFTLWDQDCVVTVDELSKLPLPKMSKLYTV